MSAAMNAAKREPPSNGGDERVSVVIPAHDEAGYLEAALASVLAQDYPLERLECVVVENASTDATAQIASDFAAQHEELRICLAHEPRLGVSRAKNRGARLASGDLLIFLDADSRMAPGLARAVVARRRAGDPAGSIRIVADSDALVERGFFALMELGALLFGIRSEMFYCDRALFLALGGFDETIQLAEDLEFLDRVKAHLRRERVKGKRRQRNSPAVCHIRRSVIRTSPRRLRTRPHHLAIVTLFARWALAFAGVGRKRDYAL